MAAVDFFLKLDGIPGDSVDRDHKDEIEILSFSWGVQQTGTSGGGGGGGAGKAVFQDFHFASSFSKASPQLFLSCASGKHIKMATLVGRKGGDKSVDFYKVTLTDIIISSYQSSGASGDSLPTDSFSLNFAKIEFNGTTWDLRDNTGG